jgi:hypothetical protein
MGTCVWDCVVLETITNGDLSRAMGLHAALSLFINNHPYCDVQESATAGATAEDVL